MIMIMIKLRGKREIEKGKKGKKGREKTKKKGKYEGKKCRKEEKIIIMGNKRCL